MRNTFTNKYGCVAGVPTAGLSTSHNRFTDVLYSFCTFFYIIFIDFFVYVLCMYCVLCRNKY